MKRWKYSHFSQIVGHGGIWLVSLKSENENAMQLMWRDGLREIDDE